MAELGLSLSSSGSSYFLPWDAKDRCVLAGCTDDPAESTHRERERAFDNDAFD